MYAWGQPIPPASFLQWLDTVLGRSAPFTPKSLRASQMPTPYLLVSVSGTTRLPLV